MKPILIAALAALSGVPAAAVPAPPVETPLAMNAQEFRRAVDGHKADISYRTTHRTGIRFTLPRLEGIPEGCVYTVDPDGNPAAEARLDFLLNRGAYEPQLARARRLASELEARRMRDALLDVRSDYSGEETESSMQSRQADRQGARALGAREAYAAFGGDPARLMMTPAEIVADTAEYRMGSCLSRLE